jgi:hypothetical protein
MLHNMKHDDTTSPDCKRIVDWEVQDERKEKMQKIVKNIMVHSWLA